ncbi:response regulator [Candidatus Daviesbacteria bacterium]|nr:response regulator [Candidatus Daviesbacteria bacterium]
MSPKEAKVFLAEDDVDWRKHQRRAMENSGHEIVIEVDNVPDGLSAIPQAKELGVNVALIDGRIPNGRLDGMILTRALKDSIPDIKVVDVSSFGDVENADAKMTKTKFDSTGLGKLVTEL